MLRREESMINRLNNMVAYMIRINKTIDIDVIEATFEGNCNMCNVNRSCNTCPIKERYVQILDMEVGVCV